MKKSREKECDRISQSELDERNAMEGYEHRLEGLKPELDIRYIIALVTGRGQLDGKGRKEKEKKSNERRR